MTNGTNYALYIPYTQYKIPFSWNTLKIKFPEVRRMHVEGLDVTDVQEAVRKAADYSMTHNIT